MNLFIQTLSDGSPVSDKTISAVTSVTDATQIEDIGNLVLGDSEPLVIKFTTGTAAPSFAGDATYSPCVSLGAVSADGSLNYTSTTAFTTTTGGWTGRLALDTTDLIAAVQVGGGGWLMQQPANIGARGAYLTLQVRVTDPSGNVVTYALLPVFVEWRVVQADSEDTDSSAYLLGSVHPRTDITSLTGGGATALDGILTANLVLPTGYTVLLSYGRVGQTWQLIAGTDAESPSTGVIRPDDYNAVSNARIWVQL